ncbi:MAG: CvpA family protein [Gammaproteobacteria bacterium]|nr:CvpA family protein [Gammaproteobacteria bacterium]MCP5139021.1 CvpA family protein [Chromatiales bacterium]
MNTVDYILVVLVAVSGLVGVLRGFIREALSVLVWILALWGAARFGGQMGTLLNGFLHEPALQLWAGRTLAFVGILFAGSLLGWLVGYLIRNSAVTGTDRVLGLLFGLARGLMAMILVVLVLKEGGFESESWWQRSKLIPYAAAAGEKFWALAGQQVKGLGEQAGVWF